MTRNEVRGLLALAVLIAVGVGIRNFSARREGAGVWVEHPAAQALPGAAGPNKSLPAPAGRNIPFTQPSQLPKRLNLNTATEQDLAEALPGIGAAKARAIVTRRVQKGGFRNVRELLEVPGIGQKTLEKLEPLLFVSGDAASTTSLMARPILSGVTSSSLPAAVPAATPTPQVASPPLSPALPGPAVPAPAAPPVQTPAPTASPPLPLAPPALGESNLVNINTASPEALQTLTHIGPKRAQDIVKYRQTHGLFRRIEDLQNVPGIGPGILDENRNRIRVR
jgi:competence protein ComEA